MDVLYFPYSYLPEWVRGALAACFDQVTVLGPSGHDVPEPMRRWAAGGRISLRLPEARADDPLPKQLKAYEAWASLHEGERPDFEALRPTEIPLYDQTAVTRLLSDIRFAGETTPNCHGIVEEQALLQARLFLALAQRHDQYQEELTRDLAQVSLMHATLFDRPAGHSPIAADRHRIRTSTENDEKIGRRIRAWQRLALHLASDLLGPNHPTLLLTHDPLVLDALDASADGMAPCCTITGIPASVSPASDPPEALASALAGLFSTGIPDAAPVDMPYPARKSAAVATLTVLRPGRCPFSPQTAASPQPSRSLLFGLLQPVSEG